MEKTAEPTPNAALTKESEPNERQQRVIDRKRRQISAETGLFYMLESNHGWWLADHESGCLTRDATEALTWSSATEAENFRRSQRGARWVFTVTEHQWCDLATPSPVTVEFSEAEKARVAEAFAKIHTPPVTLSPSIQEIIEQQMLQAWDDLCNDTGCHPDDIVQVGRRRLEFRPGYWSRLTAQRAAVHISVQQRFAALDGTAKGLEVVAWARKLPNTSGWLFSPTEPTGEDRTRALALTDHVTATRQIAELREALRLEKIASEMQRAAADVAEAALERAEADAARVREIRGTDLNAFQVIMSLSENAPRELAWDHLQQVLAFVRARLDAQIAFRVADQDRATLTQRRA